MADGPVVHVTQVRALTLRRTQTEGCWTVFVERYRWSCDDVGRYDATRQAVARRLATSDDRAIVRGVARRTARDQSTAACCSQPRSADKRIRRRPATSCRRRRHPRLLVCAASCVVVVER